MTSKQTFLCKISGLGLQVGTVSGSLAAVADHGDGSLAGSSHVGFLN